MHLYTHTPLGSIQPRSMPASQSGFGFANMPLLKLPEAVPSLTLTLASPSMQAPPVAARAVKGAGTSTRMCIRLYTSTVHINIHTWTLPRLPSLKLAHYRGTETMFARWRALQGSAVSSPEASPQGTVTHGRGLATPWTTSRARARGRPVPAMSGPTGKRAQSKHVFVCTWPLHRIRGLHPSYWLQLTALLLPCLKHSYGLG